jgi:hypothetical protein
MVTVTSQSTSSYMIGCDVEYVYIRPNTSGQPCPALLRSISQKCSSIQTNGQQPSYWQASAVPECTDHQCCNNRRHYVDAGCSLLSSQACLLGCCKYTELNHWSLSGSVCLSVCLLLPRVVHIHFICKSTHLLETRWSPRSEEASQGRVCLQCDRQQGR